jgi:uncharacterized protein RhaS with RHS repeats
VRPSACNAILVVFADIGTVGVRYYNPVTGRYINRDPAGYPNGLNNYLYVNNNPINRIDPLGLDWSFWGVFDKVSDAAAGAADSLTGGLTNYVREKIGANATVDQESASYKGGAVAGEVVADASGAAGLAKAAVKYGVKTVVTQLAKQEVKNEAVSAAVDGAVDVGLVNEEDAGVIKAAASRVGAGTAGKTPEGTLGVVAKTPSGKRVGDFTPAQRKAAKVKSAKDNNGTMACKDCDKPLENIANEKGVPTPPNQAQVHHDPAIVEGGGQHSTPVVLCPECHKARHANE